MNRNQILHLLRVGLPWIGWVVAGLLGIYHGTRRMLSTWDWYCYRFRDYDVFEVIDTPKVSTPLVRTSLGRTIAVDSAYPGLLGTISLYHSVEEIKQKLGRSEKSVQRSLRRLKKNKQAVDSLYGWCSRDKAPNTN